MCMKTYTSLDGIVIKVGENAKENDDLTLSSYPMEWWLHVDGGPGSHVIVCFEEDSLPRETKRDAALLAIHHGKSTCEKSSRVYLDGPVMQMTVFKNKEKERLERLLKTRRND